ncbi:hypothetical protein N9164_09915 [Draconibacterium sp.]|nr:hypothetical protein [Draconibacterium sp.]
MKSFKKNYIGKGTQVVTKEVKKLDIVKVTLKVEEVLKHKRTYKDIEYVTFEVAQMQKPDDYERTHTAYVSTYEPKAE